MSIVIEPVNYRAARYACEHWHYSGKVPASKNLCYGIWENKKYIGCIIFGRGTNRHIGDTYKLKQTQVCELVRIALCIHKKPVSMFISMSLKLLKAQNPSLRLVVSYADQNHNHFGIIYQAANWFYVGEGGSPVIMEINGEIVHPRTVGTRYNTRSIEWLRENVDPKARYIRQRPKYKYLYPLDKKMRKQILPLSKSYPRPDSVDGSTVDNQSNSIGSIPVQGLT